MNKDTFYSVLVIFIGILVIFIFFGMQIGTPIQTDSQDIATTTPSNPKDKSDLIVLTYPLPEATVSSPLIITGQARGYWFFEATFPVILTDWDGLIIAEGYAEAILDPNDETSTWMTEDFVPFKATLEYTVAPETLNVSNRGSLILRKDNPSGLPENDDALEITIYYEKK
ncbi:hypothetical protein COW81_02430 [Candidatus Campbellbacteria bacterium CG22_combo_CG10-13_8_21_14_all_36_13]|uniref:Bacterial spore germination immunoglobulin-like domain-containing protein n=1 Tax=Candidatus Campbellbacteria bacterium CG22_combo_CG10-13_8_21_14_all_36_13 TaxID=1974529 RepID=A0A2H0DXW5_9BACT|nr:MAG: hypothetical protein COW81_02430 [Candidatus Campbellbacteria bacterium CG22_combo_CG10-13_8_21_14_all_36_13]